MNTKLLKKIVAITTISAFTVSNMLTGVDYTDAASDTVVYPLKEISKLECRFQDFDDLSSNCKQSLPILNTDDYVKYSKLNDGYNDYTRLYTVLWGSSYTYGWDVGHGGHIWTDIATAKGTPVYTIADGTVLYSKNDTALWNMVSVKHYINGKSIVSTYAHMSKLLVKAGDTLRAWDMIWKVWSTWNSTWNHLHLQIDLAAPFYPYYYDYNACPYSYYTISETGKCFSELEKHSIDPLLFLETNGAVLDDYEVSTTTSSSNSGWNTTVISNLGLFDKTVYIGYNSQDIKDVQELFTKLGYYRGDISGDYEDILDDIIDYQIDKWVIANKYSYGAGYFGPGTRAQAKIDYNNYLAWDNSSSSNNNSDEVTVITSKPEVEKIEKETLMSREEIEAREVQEFLDDYNVELNFQNVGWNIEVGKTVELNLKVTDKKGKAFRWNMPSGMTFVADSSTVSIFPEKLFYFTDGTRDIFIKGLKPGNITISVKVWWVTVKRLSVKVYEDGRVILPDTAVIAVNSNPVVGEVNNALVVFKDDSGANLLNLEYGSTYKLQTGENLKVCMKSWSISNISSIMKQSCEDNEFTNDVTFSYEDTVDGIVVFDYKALASNNQISIINTQSNKTLASANITTKSPKDLDYTDTYMNEIMHLLSQWVVSGINNGYFLNQRDVTQYDTLTWIENALYKYQDQATSADTAYKIAQNINEIQKVKKTVGKYDTVTRKDLLEYTYQYLVFEDSSNIQVKNYRDLDNDENLLASYVLNNKTWNDQFGENYFQPTKKCYKMRNSVYIKQYTQSK